MNIYLSNFYLTLLNLNSQISFDESITDKNFAQSSPDRMLSTEFL